MNSTEGIDVLMRVAPYAKPNGCLTEAGNLRCRGAVQLVRSHHGTVLEALIPSRGQHQPPDAGGDRAASGQKHFLGPRWVLSPRRPTRPKERDRANARA